MTFRAPSILVCVALLLGLTALGPGVHASGAGRGLGAAPSHVTVYTETNAAGGNQIVIYQRTGAGGLQLAGKVNSGGRGSGILTDTAGALSLSQDGRRLVAVNAGSNSVSAFSVGSDGSLRLTGTAPSGGVRPNSVTIHNDLVYVLNAPTQRITGLRLEANGSLVPLPGSARHTGGGLGAQVRFNPAGTMLVVSNRKNGTMKTFHVDAQGYAQPAARTSVPLPGPYGFDFTRNGTLLMADANVSFPASGARFVPGGSAVVSYALEANGSLRTLSVAKDGTTLSCWLAASPDGAYAWTSNFGRQTGSISSFHVGAGGRLSLIASYAAFLSQRGARFGEEVAVSGDGRYLYVERVDAGPPDTRLAAINAYQILPGGGVRFRGTVSGLPGSDTGLVAR